MSKGCFIGQNDRRAVGTAAYRQGHTESCVTAKNADNADTDIDLNVSILVPRTCKFRLFLSLPDGHWELVQHCARTQYHPAGTHGSPPHVILAHRSCRYH